MTSRPEAHQEIYPIHLHVPGVLRLLSEHLYSNPQTALRELIQNAHDSCVRRVTEDRYLPSDYEPRIDISLDPSVKQLTISDNGAGLTREEIHQYLSTVGRGYSSKLRERLESGDHQGAADLIGQFGLGLLAAFLVAERMVIKTRSYQPGAESCHWESAGDANYALRPAEGSAVGMSLTLHLKQEGEFLLNEGLTRDAIRHYADYLKIRITLNRGARPVNAMDAPWYRNAPAADCAAFLADRTEWQSPLSLLPLADIVEPVIRPDGSAEEVRIPLRGVLIIPAPSALSIPEYGTVSVFVRRMFITDAERDLLPRWARFVCGIVESPALMPTASREQIRHNEMFTSIQRGLESQLLQHLQQLAEIKPKIWERIVECHSDLIKGWALSSPDLFELIAARVCFPTSSGELTIPAILEKTGGAITYARGTRASNGVLALLCSETVVDASGYGDEEFLLQYAASHPDINLRLLNKLDLTGINPVRDPSFYQQLVDYFAIQGIIAKVIEFASPEFPAYLVEPSRAQSGASPLTQDSALEESVGFFLDEYRRLHQDDHFGDQLLYLNSSSPLIQRLAQIVPGTSRWTAALEILYRTAQIASGRLRSAEELHEAYSLLSFSLSELLDPDT